MKIEDYERAFVQEGCTLKLDEAFDEVKHDFMTARKVFMDNYPDIYSQGKEDPKGKSPATNASTGPSAVPNPPATQHK